MKDIVVRSRVANSDMKCFGIHVLHFKPEIGISKGGATIAFKPVIPDECDMFPYTSNRRMVEISIIYCSTKDSFNKKIGKTLAVETFMEGHVIFLRIPKSFGKMGTQACVRYLKEIFFDNCVEYIS